jgi:hypothetical protein
VAERIWVGLLNISARTASKLASRHGLQAQEVHDAVHCVEGLQFSWDHDPERGTRAIIRVPIRGRVHLVVLYPDPEGPFHQESWNLGSAYPE